MLQTTLCAANFGHDVKITADLFRLKKGLFIVRFGKGILWSVWLSVACGLLMSSAIAQESDGAPGSKAYKIGIVDRKLVFDAYEKTKVEYENLQKQVEVKQSTVDKLSKNVEAQKEEYDKKKDTMTDVERAEFENKVKSDYHQYRSELERMQSDIDSMELLVVKKLFAQIDRAISTVGAQGNYHLVLDGTEKETPGSVIYFSTTLNMTQKVIDYINSHDMSKEN